MKLLFSEENFPGILITFCGLDGSGKTTQIDLLENRLVKETHSVFRTFQPTKEMRKNDLFRTFVDGKQNDYRDLEYRSLSLLTVSDRLQHSRHVILPKLNEGKIVISDRYYYSAIVNLRARGYKKDKWIYEIAQNIPKPDLAIFLDVGFDEAIRRVRSRENEKDRYIDLKFHRNLWKEYKYVSKNTDCVILNSQNSIEETSNTIYKLVEDIICKKMKKIF